MCLVISTVSNSYIRVTIHICSTITFTLILFFCNVILVFAYVKYTVVKPEIL